MRLIIYTHTDYLDIFRIALEHLKRLPTQNIFIFANANHELYDCNGYKTYLYGEGNSYPNRISQCLRQLDNNDPENDYILLCHDNDIVMSFNNDYLDKISRCMKDNNIDRVGLITLCDKRDLYKDYFLYHTIDIEGQLKIVKNPQYWAYSVGPSIWNRRRFIDLLLTFHYKDYRSIEDEQVQEYVRDNMIVYNVGVMDDKVTYIDRTSNKNIASFLHITVRGYFIVDMEHLDEVKYIKKYRDKYASRWKYTLYENII